MILSCGIFAEYSSVFQKGGAIWNDHVSTSWQVERMREIRRQRNISVKQVMEYMGFESTQAVYKWEAGKCYPQADNLVALAILYNVSPMELLVEEDRVSSSSCLWGNLFVA